MAIKISSNVPQQQTTNPSSFGAIKTYQSSLANVKVADTGRGLGQAAQGLVNLSNHVRKKEEELANRNANQAVTNYGLLLQEKGDKLQQAIKNGDPASIDEAQADFDGLNPESKDFSFNNYADEPVDEKYYARYTGQVRLGYSTNATNYSNLKTEISLFDLEDKNFKSTRELYYKWKLNPQDNSAANTFITSALNNANSVSNNFSERETKVKFQQKYSKQLNEFFESKFATAKNEFDLNSMRKDLYEDLLTDEWGFFNHEEAVNDAYVKRLGELTSGNGEETKANAKTSLDDGRGNIDTMLEVIEESGFGRKDLWQPYMDRGVTSYSEIQRVDPTDPNSAPVGLENRTDIEKFYSGQVLFGLFSDVPHIDNLREDATGIEMSMTPFQEDVINYVRFKNLPTDLPDTMIPSDRQAYIKAITDTGDDIKEDLSYRDSARAFETLFGEPIDRSELDFVIKDLYGVKSRGVTLYTPDYDFPTNWANDPDKTFRYMKEAFSLNSTGNIANVILMSLQSGKSKELSYEQIALLDVINKGVLYSGIDTQNPEVFDNFLREKIDLYTTFYQASSLVTEGSDEEKYFKDLYRKDKEQPEQYRLELFKQAENAAVRMQPGLRSFYMDLAKGFVALQVRDDLRQAKKEGFLIGDTAKLYNFFQKREREVFSDGMGFITKSTNGTRVLLFGSTTDNIYEGGRRIEVLGFQKINRLLQKSLYFRNLFRTDTDSDDPDADDPKFHQRELADSVMRGAMFKLSQQGVNYRQEIDIEKFKDSELLSRYEIQKKVLKEYERGDLTDLEIYEGLVMSDRFALEHIGQTSDGKFGLVLQYIDKNGKPGAYIDSKGEDFIYTFEEMEKDLGIDLSMLIPEEYIGPSFDDPLVGSKRLALPRVTPRAFYDKKLESIK